MAGSVVSEVNDGPVLNLMNKRLRALRKKYNRIIQMEEAVSQGKSLNKEQEEVLRSKPSVVILIDEYEKLRQPLSIAVQEEHNQYQNQTTRSDDSAVEDLVRFLYLGNSFDAKQQSEFTAMMLTKTHERGCCISYDYVTDDASNDLLSEKDLDMMARLSSLLISKPADSGYLSHEKAIENCISRAKLWLSSSEEPIEPGTAVTYSELRKMVSKILGSDYLTATPEMKDPVEVVAAATAGNYTVPEIEMKAPVEVVAAAAAGSYTVPVEHSSVPLETEMPRSRELVFMVNHEKYEPVATQEQVIGDGHSHPVEELAKDESESELSKVDAPSAQHEENKQEDVIDQNPEDEGWQEQHSRRSYQNQRGGGRGGFGGRRGSNGRGGRGNRGGGGFHNGRGQNGEQPGNYNSRNYNNSRGRGGRGAAGHGYNNNHASADHVRSAQAGVDC